MSIASSFEFTSAEERPAPLVLVRDLGSEQTTRSVDVSGDWTALVQAIGEAEARGSSSIALPRDLDGDFADFSQTFKDQYEVPILDEGGTVIENYGVVEWHGESTSGERATLSLVRTPTSGENWSVAAMSLEADDFLVAVSQPPERLGASITLSAPVKKSPATEVGDADYERGKFDPLLDPAHPANTSVLQKDTLNAGTQRIDLLAVGLVNPNASSSQFLTQDRALSGVLAGISDVNVGLDAGSSSQEVISGVYLRLVGLVMIEKGITSSYGDRNFIRDDIAVNWLAEDLGADLTAGLRYQNFTDNKCGRATIGGYASVSRLDSPCPLNFAHEIGHNLDGEHNGSGGTGSPVNKRTLLNVDTSYTRARRYANFYVMWPGTAIPTGPAIVNHNAKLISHHASATASRRDPAPAPNGKYQALSSPLRLIDSRDGTGGLNAPLAANSPTRISLTSLAAFGDFNAVMINVAIIPLGSNPPAGYVQVAKSTTFLTSSYGRVLYHDGDVRSAGHIAAVNADGTTYIKSTVQADVVIDVIGYFGSGTLRFDPRESAAQGTTHVRAFDDPVVGNTTVTIPIGSACAGNPYQEQAVGREHHRRRHVRRRLPPGR